MKRVNLAMSDETYAMLYQLSDLRGESMSGIVVELIEAQLPAWRREVRSLKPLRSREDELQAEADALRARVARAKGTKRRRIIRKRS